jgi:hypothetical protein
MCLPIAWEFSNEKSHSFCLYCRSTSCCLESLWTEIYTFQHGLRNADRENCYFSDVSKYGMADIFINDMHVQGLLNAYTENCYFSLTVPKRREGGHIACEFDYVFCSYMYVCIYICYKRIEDVGSLLYVHMCIYIHTHTTYPLGLSPEHGVCMTSYACMYACLYTLRKLRMKDPFQACSKVSYTHAYTRRCMQRRTCKQIRTHANGYGIQELRPQWIHDAGWSLLGHKLSVE